MLQFSQQCLSGTSKLGEYGSPSGRGRPSRGSGRACCAGSMSSLSFQYRVIHKEDLLLFVVVIKHCTLMTFAKRCIQGSLQRNKLALLSGSDAHSAAKLSQQAT